MSRDRLFLDTVFIQAILNRRDQYHERAQLLLPRVRTASEVWTTEAVLVEVGNALSGADRLSVVDFVRRCYQTVNMRIVTVDTALLNAALTLYASRLDKAWGLTDCLSFTVMEQQGLITAATADEHFLQAGYRALMLESEG